MTVLQIVTTMHRSVSDIQIDWYDGGMIDFGVKRILIVFCLNESLTDSNGYIIVMIILIMRRTYFIQVLKLKQP